MKILMIKRVLFLFLMILLPSANAAPLNLIGGVTDPDNVGPVPVPPNEPVALTTIELSSISDGNINTGFVFMSSQGTYSSDPDTVIGFGIRYDFDVSAYQSIDNIKFTWTGLMSWTGNTFSDVWLGAESYMPQARLVFGESNSPDNIVRTGVINFYPETSNFYYDLNYVLHDGIASFWAHTGLAISCTNCVDNLYIQTLDVSADVTGTLRPVPVPSALWMFISGAMLLFGMRTKR